MSDRLPQIIVWSCHAPGHLRMIEAFLTDYLYQEHHGLDIHGDAALFTSLVMLLCHHTVLMHHSAQGALDVKLNRLDVSGLFSLNVVFTSFFIHLDSLLR